MKPFNLEKALAGDPVVTRDGKKVTEIVHLKTVSPSRSIIFVVDGRAYETGEDGRFYFGMNTESVNELFMEPKIVKKEGWINIHKNECVGGLKIHPSKEEADYLCSNLHHRVACVKIEWEEEQ